MLRKSLISVSALTAMIGSASAQEGPREDWNTQVLQSFSGIQEALNTITVTGTLAPASDLTPSLEGPVNTDSELPGTSDEDARFAVTLSGQNRQLINNAANILTATDTVISNLTQTTTGQQSAINRVTATNDVGQIGDFVQLGENLANVVDAQQINNLNQQFGPGALQAVENSLTVGGNTGTITQIARNTANVATAQISIGPGSQNFPFDSIQTISNRIHLTSDNPVSFGSLEEGGETLASRTNSATELPSGNNSITPGTNGDIIQEAQNFGNVLVADEVRDVLRTFNGEQRIINSVIVDGPEDLPNSVTQTGLNIANFVSASEVSGLTQESNGIQVVDNSVTDSSLASLTSQLSSYSQTSENYVNVLNIVGSSRGTETAAASAIRAGQVNNANQISRANAAGRNIQVGNSSNITR